jgi:hypothetical protein
MGDNSDVTARSITFVQVGLILLGVLAAATEHASGRSSQP